MYLIWTMSLSTPPPQKKDYKPWLHTNHALIPELVFTVGARMISEFWTVTYKIKGTAVPIYYYDPLTTICQCDILALMNKLMLCHKACGSTKISIGTTCLILPFKCPVHCRVHHHKKKHNFGVIITELLTEMALSWVDHDWYTIKGTAHQ